MRVLDIMNMQQDPWGSDFTEEVFPHDRQHLSGIPQQTVNGHGGQIFLQPPSVAPKAIGILFVIYGLISSLGVLSPFFETRDFLTGEVIEFPLMYDVLSVSGSVVAAFTAILGGVWLTQYQRRGIHLILLGVAVTSLLAFASIFLGYDGGLSSVIDNKSATLKLLAVGQTITAVMCGLLAAIPIMIGAPGLDNSSLFRLK